MFELFIAGGKKRINAILPDELGPGPQELIGYYETPENPDRHSGFFGETLASNLIDGSALASLIGLTVGTSQNSTDPWLKFVLDGRVLFVPKRALRHSLSWNHLNSAGVITGTKTITIGQDMFKVSLLKGADANPADAIGGYDVIGSHNSEWSRLLYNVCASTKSKASQEGEQWATYTEAELNLTAVSGNGSYQWCQETNKSSTGQRARRGYNGVPYLGFSTATSTDGTCGWRPVLELVP